MRFLLCKLIPNLMLLVHFFAACHKEIKNVSLQKIIKFLNVHFFPQQGGCIPKHFANDESVKSFGTAHIVSCPTNDICRLHLVISILPVSEIDLDIAEKYSFKL